MTAPRGTSASAEIGSDVPATGYASMLNISASAGTSWRAYASVGLSASISGAAAAIHARGSASMKAGDGSNSTTSHVNAPAAIRMTPGSAPLIHGWVLNRMATAAITSQTAAHATSPTPIRSGHVYRRGWRRGTKTRSFTRSYIRVPPMAAMPTRTTTTRTPPATSQPPDAAAMRAGRHAIETCVSATAESATTTVYARTQSCDRSPAISTNGLSTRTAPVTGSSTRQRPFSAAANANVAASPMKTPAL